MNNIEYKKNRIYEGKEVSSFRDLVDGCANEYKDKIAYTYKKNGKELIDVSYIEFKEQVDSLATYLVSQGYVNMKIALLSPDRYEWCLSYLGIINSGNVVVPLDHALVDIEIENLIMRSGAEVIIYDMKYKDSLNRIKEDHKSNLKKYICFDYEENDISLFEKVLNEGRSIKDKTNVLKDVVIDKDKMSVLIYTSGTTSEPKGVMLSQANICSNLTAMSMLVKTKSEDSILIFLPLHHTLACTASFLYCYFVGCRIYFADSIKNVARNMNDYKVNCLVCVPAVLELIYKKIMYGIKKSNKMFMFKVMGFVSNTLFKLGIDVRRKIFKEVLSNLGGGLYKIIYGSASADKEIIKFFSTLGIDMVQGYGLTETSPVIACENDKYKRIKSTGFPLPNIELKIDSPNEDGEGEIITKGPHVMIGYYNNQEETNKILKDGWLYTGDLGKFDKDGYLYITGRKKELIALKNGKNVYPTEIEHDLNRIELIEESIIYDMDTNKHNQIICAKIVYSEENDLLKGKTKEEIYDMIWKEVVKLNKSMKVYKQIKEINITTEPLVRTTTQKIKRFEEMKKILN